MSKRTTIFTPYRLGFFIREGVEEGIISGYQDMMARNIMKLGSIPIKKIMIPLKRTTLVSYNASADQIIGYAKMQSFPGFLFIKIREVILLV